jgi:hypothetical protein
VIADPTDTLSPGNPPPLTIVFGPDIFDGTGGPPDAGPGNQEPSQGTPNPTNPPDDHAANGGGGGSAPETDTPQHGHGNPPGNLPPIDLEEIAQGPFGPFEVDIPGPEWHCTAGIGACSEGGPGVGGNGTPGNPMAPMGQWPNPAGRPAFAPMMPAAAPQQEANVPEPASLTLFGLGLVAIGYQRRKRAAS